MKKFFTFALVCCLVFSSSCIAFASPTQWDTSDRTLLSNIATTLTSTGTGTLLRSVNAILTSLTSSTQQGSLYNGVAYLYDIRAALTSNNTGVGSTLSTISTTLGNIWSALSFAVDGQYISAFVARIMTAVESLDVDLNTIVSRLTSINTYLSKDGMRPSWVSNPSRTLYQYSGGSGSVSGTVFDFSQQGLLGTLSLQQFVANENSAKFYGDLMGSWSSPYTRTNWITNQNQSITPTSGIRGISALLEWIQQPVARLAYVLANDQEIAARNAAAANQTAVVNDFIDPSGSGSLPTSSIGSVSDMSDSFKNNFSTDASPTGLFDIFNSDHGSWFSQETADQLDTTNISNRSLKAAPSEDFETPLLDQQVDDIYNALGVKK